MNASAACLLTREDCCRAAPRGLTYADLGGIDGVLDDIMELIVCPLKHPEVRGRETPALTRIWVVQHGQVIRA
jgi:hypothetical protein